MTRIRLNRSWLAATENSVAQTLVETRSLRGFADGLIAVVLAGYLASLDFTVGQIGVITTATLVGSAVGTLVIGTFGHHQPRVRLLTFASVLLILTGIGFLIARDYWLMLAIAFMGTVNPSSGDVSVFLPLEQAEVSHQVSKAERTHVFARFSLGSNLTASAGSLLAGLISATVVRQAWSSEVTGIIGFMIYVAVGFVLLLRYRRLPVEPADTSPEKPAQGLHKSRGIVTKLAVVFSLDSLGGGFVVQTMLIVWLHQRYGMTEAAAGLLFSITSLMGAVSMLAAPRIADRIGLINTMVFTHLPANIFLMLTPFMPTLELAVLMLILRSLLSSMDVPARTAFVMAVVEPDERSAAASFTNVPRSLASAISPAIAGKMLSVTPFGWPLIIGGACKASYDLILWGMFRRVQERAD